MNKNDIKKQRLKLLYEISDLEKGCEGCETHYELNKTKNLTAITNACKACPIGREIGQYGEKLLKLTSARKIN